MDINFEALPYDVCYDAHRGSSFTPEERAKRDVESFTEYCNSIIAQFEKYDVPENANIAELAKDVEKFLQGYRKRKMALLHAQSRHVSAFIAGPSGYPTRTMEKRMETIDMRMKDLVEYPDKILPKLHRKHDPDVKRPINSGEEDAIARLQEELEAAEKLQELMKAANKIMRGKKSDSEKLAALQEIGVTKAIAKAHYMDSGGFPRFALTNNNATIRRIKERIESVARLQSDEFEAQGDGFEIYEDAADNRLRIEFDCKPNEDVRAWLKSHGFRWSPRNVVWQRQITHNARNAAREFVAWTEER